MGGRKRKVPYENVVAALVENKNKVVVNNKVVEPSNQIWVAIHESLGKKSTPKALYNDGLRWYNELMREKSDKSDDAHDDLDISVELSDSNESYVDSENESPQPKMILISLYHCISQTDYETRGFELTHMYIMFVCNFVRISLRLLSLSCTQVYVQNTYDCYSSVPYTHCKPYYICMRI